MVSKRVEGVDPPNSATELRSVVENGCELKANWVLCMGSVVMMGTWVSWVGSNWNSGQVVTSMVFEVVVVAGKVVAPKQSKEKSKSVLLNSKAELVSSN